MKTAADCAASRRWIDDHFAGRIAPRDERVMRAHLARCSTCSSYYQRHLLFERLDPRSLGAKTRLARGLGLRHRPPLFLRSAPLLCAATAVAACLVVWLRTEVRSGFQSRGSPRSLKSELVAYKTKANRPAEPAVGHIRVDDELAFAYRNPRHFARLLVLAVDEHKHIYWYYPAWRQATENPSAVSISPSDGLSELPESVAQPLDGTRLRVLGIFTNAQVSVQQIERVIAEQGADSQILPGSDQTTLDLKLER